MLRLLWRFLCYFRWPTSAALLTVFALIYILQPRPTAEHRFPSKGVTSFGFFNHFLVSPSGQFALLFTKFDQAFELYHLTTARLIFKSDIINDYVCRFDADDGLVFASYGTQGKAIDDIVEWWRWQPGQSMPQQLGSRESFPKGLRHSANSSSEMFSGLVTFDNHHPMNLILSSDARTWLIPNRSHDTFSFDLIDAKTGKIRSQLNMSAINLLKPTTPYLSIAFAPDCKTLLAESEIHRDERFDYQRCLELFDTQKGRRLSIWKLPFEISLGRFSFFHDRGAVSIKTKDTHCYLQQFSFNTGYRLLMMKETVADAVELPFDQNVFGDHIAQAVPEFDRPVAALDGKLVYCWWHTKRGKSMGGSGIPDSYPGYYYAVRDMDTGNLIHTDKLTLHHNLVDILPGPALLLKRHNEPPHWQLQLEQWRQQYANWILPLIDNHIRITCIDAISGTQMARFSFPSERQVASYFNAQLHTLYLAAQQKDCVLIHEYHYPFRKPWLLILSWSAGVFITLAILQLLYCFIRHGCAMRPIPKGPSRSNIIPAAE
ncbi:MAG TPA: hypothetical protein PLX97_05855 [Gemmatales bacterium]|nr:hypothetical protein [Gemmatales bacterium]